MVVSVSHHGVHRGRVLAGVRSAHGVLGNNKIVHLLPQNLAALGIFDVASCGACSVLRAVFVVFVSGAIFHAEVCVSIELLSARAMLVAFVTGTLLRNNAHGIN